MNEDKQSKKIVESRSDIGTMSFEDIKKFIGVDMDPEKGTKPSGTPGKIYKDKK